jgi:hypothetical protein
MDKIYHEFIKQGVDSKEIEKPQYSGDKMRFLLAWLLPPHSPSHQLYTHKGADYDYSKEPDGDNWSAKEKNQSCR